MTGRAAQLRAIRRMTPNQRTHALGRIQGEAYLSAQGVVQQASRLRQNQQCGPEFMVDGRLLAYLFRDVMRAAEAARPLLFGRHLSELDAALARVRGACPDAIDARDALEHFDDYIFGVGRQQQARPGDYTQGYERGGPCINVCVGGLVINVDAAEHAALHLADVLLVAEDSLCLLPDEVS